MISDLVWRRSKPDADVLAFWQKNYPDMATAEVRIEQAEVAGYKVLDSFVLNDDAWKAYIAPLQERVDALKPEMPESEALRDLDAELEIYRKGLGEFGYQMFVLKLN